MSSLKNLLPALLLCLSVHALGADSYLSDPIDVVGTPLQQDFKHLYREVYQAETDYASSNYLHKPMSAGWVARMEKFLEYAAFAPYHRCEEVELEGAPGLGHKGDSEDRVYVSFRCAVGEKSIEHVVTLSLGVKGDSYQYLVQFYWSVILKNDIWDD